MALASTSRHALARLPPCTCPSFAFSLPRRRKVAELVKVPERYTEENPSDHRPPYLPPDPAQANAIQGIPYPRGQVTFKPKFEYDPALTPKENRRREKVHEKWRKTRPFATSELYAHHTPDPYAHASKLGLMVFGVALFVIALAYTNQRRLKAQAQELALAGGTPPERPPKPRVQRDPEGGDATMAAMGAPAQLSPPTLATAPAPTEDSYSPKPLTRRKMVGPNEQEVQNALLAKERQKREEASQPAEVTRDSWVATLERGNARLA